MIIALKKIWKTWWYGELYMVLAAIAAQSINISVGLCQGYSAVLLPQLAVNETEFTSEQGSWVASLGVISNPIGALLGGLMVDGMGRRATLQAIAMPGLIGWAIISLSDNYLMLCTGRFITGFVIGMSTCTYIYVAEISTPKMRGVLAALGPALVSFGILLVYVMGSFLHWKIVALVCAVLSILNPILMQFAPESPMWLASKGRCSEAYDAIYWLRRNVSLAKQEMDELSVGNTKLEESFRNKLDLVSKWTAVKPFLILVTFFMFQELSGIYVILYYAVDFFKEIGNSAFNEFTVSMIVGGIRLIMGILGVCLISKIRRKLLATISGILLSLTMLGSAVCASLDGDPSIKLFCILANVSASMVGFLQLPWIMSGELYPDKIRGVMSGATTCCAYILIFINIKTYPMIKEYLTNTGVLYLFGGCSLIGALFCILFLPETNGKSLNEITKGFQEKSIKKENSYKNSHVIEGDLTKTNDNTVQR